MGTRRARRAARARRHPSFGPRDRLVRLRIEPLEPRLVLSAAPLIGYARVRSDWFTAVTESAAGGAAVGDAAAEVADRWIVRLAPEAAQQAGNVAGAASLLSSLPVSVVRGLGLSGQLLVTGTAAASAVSAALAASPLVASYQRDSLLGGTAMPNDVQFADQYSLLNSENLLSDIDAVPAWDITTGSPDVVVAVIDSGINYNHPDLLSNVWTNPGETAGDNIDNDQNGFIDDVRGWDFHNEDNNPTDDHGHGTHVAGTIGAVGNNSLGVAGVNWATSLLPVKFLDQNNVGSVSDAVAAVNYVTMMRQSEGVNVRVINASWGGSGANDPALRAAIEAAGAAGILFVSAAGNGDVFGRGQDIDQVPFFPASFTAENVLTVAATDQHDQLTTFSNYGQNAVDIAAPGQSIWSTDLFIDTGQPIQTTYSTRSGTSMAAPLVSGVAALVWSASPSATMTEVRQAILGGGDPLAQLQDKVASGKRLNALGALVSLPPQATVTSAPDVTTLGGTSYSFNVNLTSNVLLDATTINNGDFVVRKRGSTGADREAIRTSPPPAGNALQIAATYQIEPPGGNWDLFDAGTYDIVLVAGQVTNTGGGASKEKVVDTFAVDFTSLGVFRPDVFTDNPAAGLTLREAVQQANQVGGANGGVVILAAGTYVLSQAGAGEDAAATGDLDITGHVTITVDGTSPAIINSAGIDRVFDVQSSGNLSLQGLTIQGGAVAGVEGGGIRSQGALAITNSTVRNNSASLGGGIYNAGTLTIDESTIADNTAAAGDGGGVYNAVGATTSISASTITDNSAIAFDPFPVSHYAAEGNASDSVDDNDGVLLGSTTFAAGQIGQAFNFDASSGTRVEVPGLSDFQSQVFTVEAWVNADGPGSNNDAFGGVIVTKDRGTDTPVTSFAMLGPGTTGRFSFEVGFTDGSGGSLVGAGSYAFGSWHHVAMTWDGNLLRGYVDGNLEGELIVGTKLIQYNAASGLSIGSHSPVAGNVTAPNSGRRYDGRIDEVKIYDQVLTAAELQGALRGGDGGGIYNAGTLNATNVTISGNEAANQGGGIHNAATGTATLTNVTITENAAAGVGAETAFVSVGDEFRVNTTTSGTQGTADVTMDPSGRVGVV